MVIARSSWDLSRWSRCSLAALSFIPRQLSSPGLQGLASYFNQTALGMIFPYQHTKLKNKKKKFFFPIMAIGSQEYYSKLIFSLQKYLSKMLPPFLRKSKNKQKFHTTFLFVALQKHMPPPSCNLLLFQKILG